MNYQAIRDFTILRTGFDEIPIETRRGLFDLAWAESGNNEAEVKGCYEKKVKAYLGTTKQEHLLSDEKLGALDEATKSAPPSPAPPPPPPIAASVIFDLGVLLVLVDALHVAVDPAHRQYAYTVKTRADVLAEVLKQVRSVDLNVLLTTQGKGASGG